MAGLLAGLALGLMAQSAAAQDGWSAARPADDWRGIYAGIHAGGGIGRANGANTSGLVGGVQAGVNGQVDRYVFGAEADATLSGVDHSGFAQKFRQKWLASLRARGGVAIDRALVYGTAGLAAAAHEFKGAGPKTDHTQTGYVLGAGAEYRMTEKVSLRGEALHYGFGRAHYPTTLGSVPISPSTNVLRGGVNMRF
jgi:outer membrane immunogenic protein